MRKTQQIFSDSEFSSDPIKSIVSKILDSLEQIANLLDRENLTEEDFGSPITGFFVFFADALKNVSQSRVAELKKLAQLQAESKKINDRILFFI